MRWMRQAACWLWVLASAPAAALDAAELAGRDDPAEVAAQMSRGPRTKPEPSATSFDGALRCMDKLFVTYGVRDVTLLVEDLPDATKKVNTGAREMFLSAVSRMTQRSRALKLIPYQPASVAFSERRDFIERARFVLQASVSQLDESVVKRQRDGGVCLGPVCLGAAESDSYSALGLDMNLIAAADLSLVPGVTSRNVVLVVKRGVGADGEISMRKWGLNYNFTLSRSEGNGQALRSLIELGSVELFGRLLRIPYWGCLGMSASQPEVAAEIDDWWESFAADQPALVRWLRSQMTARGLYRRESEGRLDVSLLRAVAGYRKALGLEPTFNVDAAFLRAYLSADHAPIEPSARTAMSELPSPIRIVVRGGEEPRDDYKAGESYAVDLALDGVPYVYCYLIDGGGQVQQFFPNAHQPSADVKGLGAMSFPGEFGFKFVAGPVPGREMVACLGSLQDLGATPLAASKLREVRDATIDADAFREAFERITERSVTLGYREISVR